MSKVPLFVLVALARNEFDLRVFVLRGGSVPECDLTVELRKVRALQIIV